MSYEYRILWVDDNKKVAEHYQEKLEKYLEETYDFKLKLMIDGGELIEKCIETGNYDKKYFQDFDLIITDYNILGGDGEDELTGEEVIKFIRDQDILTDILLYSFGSDIDSKVDYKEMGKRGMIKIMGGKEDAYEGIIEIIQKNNKQFENIIFCRGFILSEVVEFEMKLNEFIEKYLNKSGNENLKKYVLRNRGFNLGSKIMALTAILDDNGLSNSRLEGGSKLKDVLQKINQTRNDFAHCECVNNELILDRNRSKKLTPGSLMKLYREIKESINTLEDILKKLNENN
ncbi:CheY-like chemotaxis protein [Methanococcus maripaludis]|uniref:CheY-like chemotaxis protein n=1 Tax=Methanococcus maripaludis TaxID=39152 RepID=A0A7J9S986_METMI|nr:hypothetical protein [Methanococcus maripaludis]MBB6402463.1 CheY-like chemotaxis protein [Methanococcus maripaludis]